MAFGLSVFFTEYIGAFAFKSKVSNLLPASPALFLVFLLVTMKLKVTYIGFSGTWSADFYSSVVSILSLLSLKFITQKLMLPLPCLGICINIFLFLSKCLPKEKVKITYNNLSIDYQSLDYRRTNNNLCSSRAILVNLVGHFFVLYWKDYPCYNS